ncbi:MAG: DoxX family protein [Flavipsychrobacter sp.]
MKLIKKIYKGYLSIANNMQSLALLFMRLILAYGFYKPATMKLNNIEGIASWFEDMGLPFPLLNAYMATGTEVLGFILLALGFGVRVIAIPLVIVMLVAIKTVHWGNGFDAGDNGFEIPLYYIAMLLVLIAQGAGKISLDHLLNKKK